MWQGVTEILTASKQYYAAFQSVRSVSKSSTVTARIGAADTNATLRRNQYPMSVACRFVPIPPTVD